LRRFERICAHPERAYRDNWSGILKNVKTGSLLRLGPSAGLEELRKLPLTDYENYKPDFTKSLETRVNPYTLERIHYWANSTGTTGQFKTLPVTPAMDRDMRNFSKFRFAQLLDRFDLLTAAPEIVFVLPGETRPAYPHLPIGVIGYYHYKSAPLWLAKHFVFSKKLYRDEAVFNKWYLLMSLLSDASGISTPIPAKVIHFLSELELRRTELLEMIEKETWPKALCNHYSAERILFLKEALKSPVKAVKAIWPSLKFVCVWMAGESCRRQVEELQKRFDFSGVTFIDQVYTASEGIFNLPLLNEVGGPVNPCGIILEFYDAATGTFYWPWQLEVNKKYELVLTNSSGLLRYRTYDEVTCTGYFGKMAKIAFHARTGQEISLGWGTITEAELEQALLEAGINYFSRFYFSLNDKGNGITLFSDSDEYAGYLPAIEDQLSVLNPYYAGLRDKGTFSKISFGKLSPEAFHATMAKNMMNKRLFIK
jgi:hypothetical protein